MKKNKENLAQKYFSQKSDLWLDVLAISLVVLGIFIYIFGFKISFIGIPMVLPELYLKPSIFLSISRTRNLTTT